MQLLAWHHFSTNAAFCCRYPIYPHARKISIEDDNKESTPEDGKMSDKTARNNKPKRKENAQICSSRQPTTPTLFPKSVM